MARKIKGLLVVMLCLGSLWGCLEVTHVAQPKEGIMGVAFQTIVGVQAVEDPYDDAVPVFSVNLPEGWEAISCTCRVNDTGTYDCIERDTAVEAFLDSEVKAGNWYSLRAPFSGGVLGDTYTVTWTILPNSNGLFSLDYHALLDDEGAYESELEKNSPAFGNEIEIAEPIPSLSGTGFLITAALLTLAGAALILYRRRKWGRASLIILLLALTMPCLAWYLHATAPGYADDTIAAHDAEMPLARENLQAFKDSLEADPLLAQNALSSPGEALEQFFALDNEQRAFIHAVGEKELEAAIQVLLDAEDVNDIRCWINNTEEPGLTCRIEGNR